MRQLADVEVAGRAVGFPAVVAQEQPHRIVGREHPGDEPRDAVVVRMVSDRRHQPAAMTNPDGGGCDVERQQLAVHVGV